MLPPCVSLHLNENDLALLMTATSNMKALEQGSAMAALLLAKCS